DGIRDRNVTGVQTCALPISSSGATFLGGWGLPSDCTRTGRALGLCASSLAVTPAWLRTFARKMRAPASTNSGFAVPGWTLTRLRSEERRVGKVCGGQEVAGL